MAVPREFFYLNRADSELRPPDAQAVRCHGKDSFVALRTRKGVFDTEMRISFDDMNRLCSWWIQYIAEHPQPEVNSVTEEK